MKKNNNKRIDWIDTLKGLAMFLVVWGHCFPTVKGRIRKYIYSFHMPLFFLASGLTFNDSCELSIKDYTKKKLKSLMLPYLILNIAGYLIKLLLVNIGAIEKFSHLDHFFGVLYANNNRFAMPDGPTWFIATLFIVEVTFYIMRKYIKDDTKLCHSILIMGIIGYVNSLSKYQIYGPFHLESYFTAMVFYYIGYIFMKNIDRLKELFNSKFKMFVTGGALGIIGIACSVLNKNISMDVNLYGSIILFYIGALSSIFAIILFVNIFLRKSYIFKTIGKNSLFYLGYHRYLIYLIVFLVPASNKGNINILISGIIITIILFPLSILIYKFCPILVGKPGNIVNGLINKLKSDKISKNLKGKK